MRLKTALRYKCFNSTNTVYLTLFISDAKNWFWLHRMCLRNDPWKFFKKGGDFKEIKVEMFIKIMLFFVLFQIYHTIEYMPV